MSRRTLHTLYNGTIVLWVVVLTSPLWQAAIIYSGERVYAVKLPMRTLQDPPLDSFQIVEEPKKELPAEEEPHAPSVTPVVQGITEPDEQIVPTVTDPPKPTIDEAGTPPCVDIITEQVIDDTEPLVHIELAYSGGPVRGNPRVRITPEPPAKSRIADEFIKDPAHHVFFVGKPGVIYKVEVLAIGLYDSKPGFCEKEATLQVRDTRPKVELAQPASKPEELLKLWVAKINFANQEAEIKQVRQVSQAAKNTAKEIRDKRVAPDKAVEEWMNNTYLLMGSQFSQWSNGNGGLSFFGEVAKLFEDNQKLAGSDPASLLENIAGILEGR